MPTRHLLILVIVLVTIITSNSVVLANKNSDIEIIKSNLNQAIEQLRSSSSSSSTSSGSAASAPKNYYDECDHVKNVLGLPCEHVKIKTKDGFTLDTLHLPRGAPPSAEKEEQKEFKKTKVNKVAILQHGVCDSAITFVSNAHAFQNLGAILYEKGFDVFMPNARGTQFSPPPQNTREDFMRCDWDEQAAFDLPAVIDFVLNATNSEQVFYVGHSRGGTTGFALFSTINPSYAKKIAAFIALAPVVFLNYQESLVLRAMAELKFATVLANDLKIYDPFKASWLLRDVAKLPGAGSIITKALFLITGTKSANESNINSTNWQVVAKFDPAGDSVFDIEHFLQAARRGIANQSEFTFEMHNWGPKMNKMFYNSTTPPKYHLENLQGPDTYVFVGTADCLTAYKDMEALVQRVRKSVLKQVNWIKDYDHLAFTMGLDAHIKVYQPILDIFDKYL